MAYEAKFRENLTRGVRGATVPVVDIGTILSKPTYKDLKEHAMPAMNKLLNDLLTVMETPKVTPRLGGLMGSTKTKAENLKGDDKDAYEACFKGLSKESIDSMKGILRGEVSLHSVSIAHDFLKAILAMGDRTVSCGPFKRQLTPILEEAERLYGTNDSKGRPDSKTIGFSMRLIKQKENTSKYIEKELTKSAAVASALSAARGKNTAASLQARLNALREGRSVGSASATKGGRRVTRRRRSRRATTHKRR